MSLTAILPSARAAATIGGIEPEPSMDDLTLIMRVLMDIRTDVERIRMILEEDDEQEEEDS